MDIPKLLGSNLRTDGASPGSKPRGAPSPNEQGSGKKAGSTDESVTFTKTTQSMQAAQGSASTAPFDEAKVAKIKAAIAEGRYPIDNERLAGKMMGLERLLSA